jgi:hypothetical protein
MPTEDKANAATDIILNRMDYHMLILNMVLFDVMIKNGLQQWEHFERSVAEAKAAFTEKSQGND